MGFLGEIERGKQQQIQQQNQRELAIKAKAAIDIQNAADEKRRAEINAGRIERVAISFIQDSSTIASLLDKLNDFGYKGYFEDVSRISGFQLEHGFYTKYQVYEASVDPAVVKQQLDAQKRLGEASSKFGWSELASDKIINREPTNHLNVVFFGDKITTVEEKKLTEPEEVGIGIRFLKQVRTNTHRNWPAELLGIGYNSPTETWYAAAYVRVDGFDNATITGSKQYKVDIKDMKAFDGALYQVIHNPAIVHTTRMVHTRRMDWSLLSSRSGGDGGASSSDTHGDMN